MENENKPKLNKHIIRLIIGAILMIVSTSTGIIIGTKINKPTNSSSNGKTTNEYAGFEEVMNILKKYWISDIYYGKEIDENLLIDQFVGMLSTDEEVHLDPYTALIKKVPTVVDTSPKLGVTITNCCGYPVIVDFAPGSKADGPLHVNDIILGLGLNEEELHLITDYNYNYSNIFTSTLKNYTINDQVHVKYARFDDANNLIIDECKFDFGVYDQYPSAYEFKTGIADTLGVVLTGFTDSTASYDTSVQLDTILSHNDKRNLIIDLKDNGGGDLSSVVNICDLFLKKDEVVTIMEYKDKTVSYVTKNDDQYTFDHIYILQNGNTASASEILISTLTYYFPDSVTLIGNKSFGKGIGQKTVSVMNNKYSLRYTASRWKRPDGSWIGMTGSKHETGYQLGFEPKDENIVNVDDNLAIFRTYAGNTFYNDPCDNYYAFKDDNVSTVNGAFFTILNEVYGTNARVDCYFDDSCKNAISSFQTLKGLPTTGIMNQETYLYFVSDFRNLTLKYDKDHLDRVKELING